LRIGGLHNSSPHNAKLNPCDVKLRARVLTAKLTAYFETMVEIPRIKVGERQTIETLINEEVLLFAKYLRNEKKDWIPRIAITG